MFLCFSVFSQVAFEASNDKVIFAFESIEFVLANDWARRKINVFIRIRNNDGVSVINTAAILFVGPECMRMGYV